MILNPNSTSRDASQLSPSLELKSGRGVRLLSCTEVDTHNPTTYAKSLGILGISNISNISEKYNQSFAYRLYTLHTNLYISDINLTHIDIKYQSEHTRIEAKSIRVAIQIQSV